MNTSPLPRSRPANTFLIIAISAVAFAGSVFAEAEEPQWTELFNGKDLSGWHATVGKGGDENSQKPDEIFTVNDGVIHVYRGAEAGSPQYSANLYHESTWSHFHLQVEYRWLEKRFAPRTEDDRDAGILFHIHTDPEKVWPPSLEMQMGD